MLRQPREIRNRERIEACRGDKTSILLVTVKPHDDDVSAVALDGWLSKRIERQGFHGESRVEPHHLQSRGVLVDAARVVTSPLEWTALHCAIWRWRAREVARCDARP